jgi:hypothetical protein
MPRFRVTGEPIARPGCRPEGLPGPLPAVVNFGENGSIPQRIVPIFVAQHMALARDRIGVMKISKSGQGAARVAPVASMARAACARSPGPPAGRAGENLYPVERSGCASPIPAHLSRAGEMVTTALGAQLRLAARRRPGLFQARFLSLAETSSPRSGDGRRSCARPPAVLSGYFPRFKRTS